jgi:hypothetical protein
MDLATLRGLRLRVQGLRSPVDASAPEVVRRFVAVQAQEFLPAQWGLAARVPEGRRPDAAAVAAALDAGEVLRTHVLRPTWHFLHPDDARWVLELSAERVHRSNATYYRRTGVDGPRRRARSTSSRESLAGGHRTRASSRRRSRRVGWRKAGLGFTYLMMLAELERVAISGRTPDASARTRRSTSGCRRRRRSRATRRWPSSRPGYIAVAGPGDGSRLRRVVGLHARRHRGARSPTGRPRRCIGGGRIERSTSSGDGRRVPTGARGPRGDGADATAGAGVVDLLQRTTCTSWAYAAPRAYLQPPGRAPPRRPSSPCTPS